MSKNIKPSVTVNTQEFGTLLRKYHYAEFADNTVARIALISYIDAHIEQAVADACKGMVPLSADGNSVWIDGVGDVALATQQPSAEPINFENVMAIFAKQTNRFAMEKYADTFERIAQAIVDEFHNPPAHDNVLSKPAQQDDGELPPLPEPVYLGGDEAFGDVVKGHTDEAMREYGRLCRATRQPAQQATELALTAAEICTNEISDSLACGNRDAADAATQCRYAILTAAKEKQND